MTKMTTKNYAELAEDSYRDRPDGAMLTLGDNKYKILKHVEDPKTGYAGTIYQDVSSRQIIVAHRGTEPSKPQDLFTDLKMVTHGVNNQLPRAMELTTLAGKFANVEEQKTGKRPEVSVTGHSLGGTLAELTAFHKNYPGHSFNGYGAVEVEPRMSEGQNSHNFKAHYRVTDVVGTGGRHYGESIPYATKRDTELLMIDAKYDNKRGGFFDDRDRNPFAALTARGGGLASHDMGAFIRGSDATGPALLTDEARARAQKLDPAADRFAADVRLIRAGGGVVLKGLVDEIDKGVAFVDGVKTVASKLEQAGNAAREKLQEWGNNIRESARDTWENLRNLWPGNRTSGLEGGGTAFQDIATNRSYQNVVAAFNNSGIDPNGIDQRVILGLATDPKGANISFAGVSSKDNLHGFGLIAQSLSDPGAQRIDFNANGKTLEDLTQRLAQQTQPTQVAQLATTQPNPELEQPQRKTPVMTA
jgi:Lipase (class 3)